MDAKGGTQTMTRAGIVDTITSLLWVGGAAILIPAMIAGSWEGGFNPLLGFALMALAWVWSVLPYIAIGIVAMFGSRFSPA
jgi:hypothetical protein